MFFSFSFINAKEKFTYKVKYVDNKNKTKGTLLYNHKTDSRIPKVSINPTWKEGLHKRQVNYFGMVKLTNKRRRKKTLTRF